MKKKITTLSCLLGGVIAIAAPHIVDKLNHSAQMQAVPPASGGTTDATYNVPVLFSFDSEDDFKTKFKIIDNNNDGYTWQYSPGDNNGMAKYHLNWFSPADDWLVSPGLNLQKDMIYEITFDNAQLEYWSPESVRLLVGTGNDTALLSKVVADYPALAVTTHQKARFTAEETGVHYMAIQIYSQEAKSQFDIDNWGIREIAHSSAPAKPVLGLTSADESGKKVKVGIKAPSKSMGGASLTEITSIKVYRGDNPEPVHVFESLQPGKVQTWIDDTPGSGPVKYRAVACNSFGNGESEENEIFVDGIVPPYSTSFATADEAKYYTVLDVNKDESTWEYKDGSMVYTYNLFNQADDWLFTPKMRLDPTRVYEVVADIRTGAYSNSEESLRITYGENAEASGQTTLLDIPGFLSEEGESRSTYLMVPENNCYSIGFYAYSPKSRLYIYLDGVKVNDVASAQSPAAPSGMTVTADQSGGAKATVKFTAPSTDSKGNALQSLATVEIFRGDDTEPAKTISSPQPGAPLEWTDENAIEGEASYRVCATNAEGRGLFATASSYVGLDIPSTVNFLEARGNATNADATLSWEAPTAGMNGGYINPADLTYTVARVVDYSTTVIAEGITDLSYTDKYGAADTQGKVTYKVCASNAKGKGPESLTNIWLGKLWQYPVNHAFDTSLSEEWQQFDTTGTGQWVRVKKKDDVLSPDGSEGILQYRAWGQNGVLAGSVLNSPKISLENSVNPWLSVSVYHNPEEDSRKHVTVGYRINDGNSVELADIKVSEGSTGWKEYAWKIDASASDFVSVTLHAECFDNETGILLDNLMVDDRLDHNLVLDSFAGPSEFGREGAVFTVGVRNKGQKTAESYNVVLLRDGEEASVRACGNHNSGEVRTIDFEIAAPTAPEGGRQYTYSARVDYEHDMRLLDNASEELSVRIIPSDYPGIGDLQGKAQDNKVELSWGEPHTDYSHPVTDDFSSYQKFAISGLEPWTLHDGDGQYTRPVRFDRPYDDYMNPKAWQVWNPLALADPLYGADVTPHSGRQCLLSMQSTGQVPGEEEKHQPQNDDWLISEEVSGGSEVSFWMMQAVNSYGGNEGFEVLYSTQGNTPEDFHVLATETLSGKATWVQYRYTLPANAKYFAIRHNQSYFGLWLDDITYSPVRVAQTLVIEGYNIYRDGTLVGVSVSPAYTDATPLGGIHTYGVATRFNIGEGPISNLVEIEMDFSAVEEVSGDSRMIVGTERGIITVGGVIGKVDVISANGATVKSTEAHGVTKIPVEAGIYLVRGAGKTVKVIVK